MQYGYDVLPVRRVLAFENRSRRFRARNRCCRKRCIWDSKKEGYCATTMKKGERMKKAPLGGKSETRLRAGMRETMVAEVVVVLLRGRGGRCSCQCTATVLLALLAAISWL
jgi:hypothetical protein